MRDRFSFVPILALGLLFAAAGTAAAASSALTIAPADTRIDAAASLAIPGESCSAASDLSHTVFVASPRAAASGAVGPSSPDPQTIGVVCALPIQTGGPGSDCNSKNTVVFSTTGTSGAAKVVSELLALDVNGNVIQAMPVKNGNSVHMASRLSPSDYKFTQSGSNFDLFAPVPLLHVMVEDQGQKAEAFCSNIPWLQVQSPKGEVVSGSEGNDTSVLVAIPRTDPNSVKLKVDNVDLFAALGIGAPSTCTATSPCSGVATVNGNSVSVSNLIVDGTTNIATPASNTIRATVSGLSCGSHFFVSSALQAPGALRRTTSAACDVDDLTDAGSSSVFAIAITSPIAGAVLSSGSTMIEGQVCSGRQIVDVKLSAKDIDLSGETFVAGDGVTTGDLYTVPIHNSLPETDLVRDIQTGDAPLGTLDAGSNRLAASATDDLGNRTFAQVIFATGPVAPIGIDQALQATFQQQTFQNTVQNQLLHFVQPQVQTAMNATTTDIQNAFVVGLSASGTQTLFNQLCTQPVTSTDPSINGKTPGQIFRDKVTAAIEGIMPPDIHPSVPCASDPDVALTITNVTVGDSVSCNVAFNDGFFHVTVGLPNVHVDVHAFGTGGDWGADVCVQGVKVEGDAFADVSNIKLDFDVNQDNLLHATTSTPVFNAGSTVASNGTVGADFCGLSVVCNVVVTIFTFGAVDINPSIDFSKVQDFSAQIGASQPDPVHLKEIKVDENVVANFDQKLSGDVSSVTITPNGIVAGLTGHFATTVVDPDVPSTPGALLTPAPLPTLPVPNAQDVFIGVADDSINMLFASMAAAGKLKLGCVDTTKTIGDILPDCESLNLTTDAATAAARGLCHGVKGDSCEAFSSTNAVLTATEQGICHGVEGDTCSSIPTQLGTALVEIGACNITPDYNLHGTQELLFCTQEDIPPRILLTGDTNVASSVPASLRLNDLSVALVVDRDGTPGFPPSGGTLADAQSCFKNGGNTAADCNMFSACLDLNLNFNMGFETCSDGKPGFKSVFDNIQILNRQPGMVCGGTSQASDDQTVLNQTSTDNTVTIQIGQQASSLSPDICGVGLDLGGFVTCESPQLLAIDTDGSPTLKDYLAITCNVH